LATGRPTPADGPHRPLQQRQRRFACMQPCQQVCHHVLVVPRSLWRQASVRQHRPPLPLSAHLLGAGGCPQQIYVVVSLVGALEASTTLDCGGSSTSLQDWGGSSTSLLLSCLHDQGPAEPCHMHSLVAASKNRASAGLSPLSSARNISSAAAGATSDSSASAAIDVLGACPAINVSVCDSAQQQ
jgi:hypothetical protein